MIKKEIINEIFKNPNNLVPTMQLREAGIFYKDIQALINSGLIEKVKNGYYKLKQNEMSENQKIAVLFSDGIITMDSALFYYGYSDRTPLYWHIAINKNASKSRFNLDYPSVKPYYLEPQTLSYGVATANYDDAQMQIFDRDRLICEVLYYENKLDRETYNKAIQGYVNDSKKNIAHLLDYAGKRRVAKKIKDKIEVWL